MENTGCKLYEEKMTKYEAKKSEDPNQMGLG